VTAGELEDVLWPLEGDTESQPEFEDCVDTEAVQLNAPAPVLMTRKLSVGGDEPPAAAWKNNPDWLSCSICCAPDKVTTMGIVTAAEPDAELGVMVMLPV
jgi:hypothetical protein